MPEGGTQIIDKVDPTSPDPIRLGGVGKYIADEIGKRTGIESRTTVLGHIQRGGTPATADRVLGTQFGFHAVELLMGGAVSRLVVMQGNEIKDVDILTAAGKQRKVPVNHQLVEAARAVGTCFGDLPVVHTR